MDWLIEAIQRVLAFFYSLFLSLLDALYDLVCKIFDVFMSAITELISGVIAFFGAIPIPDIVPLPSGVAWVASQVGAPQMIIIVSSALIVRLLLQLIPFVRLGS
ncbi:MAG: VSK receptor [Vibrio sp.]|uniref:VSK receptor n=1 Tax=Vibrio TaxID=662 RepID=UPI001ECB058E|nr:VSK receptor [Vibrio sp.]NRB69763.1 VSK receptor [Vibrio sp.]